MQFFIFCHHSLDDLDRVEEWLDKRINRMSSDDRASFFKLSDARSSDFDEGSVIHIFLINISLISLYIYISIYTGASVIIYFNF